MPCTYTALPGGGTAIVCTGRQQRTPCSNCGIHAELRCDWKLSGPKAGSTCSRAICRCCGTTVGAAREKHLCPPHARAWANDPRNPARHAPMVNVKVWVWLARMAQVHGDTYGYAEPRTPDVALLDAMTIEASRRFTEKAECVLGRPLTGDEWEAALEAFWAPPERVSDAVLNAKQGRP